jgi:short-subunit dehydrogenase
MGRFDGKSVLITGASSGIGEALAREFARQGAAVAITARRTERLERIAGEINAAGGRAVALACDVTVDGDPERATAATLERLGGIDVAVANAGFGVAGPFADLTLDDYRRQFETNVFGVLRTARAALPELERRRGALVIMGSVAGYVAPRGASPYAMSKFAVRAFAESLRPELEPRGVAVVLISPGFVDSEIRKVDNLGRHHPRARDPVHRWLRMPVDRAARQIVRAVAARRRERVITFHGKVVVTAHNFARPILGWVIRRLVRNRGEPK